MRRIISSVARIVIVGLVGFFAANAMTSSPDTNSSPYRSALENVGVGVAEAQVCNHRRCVDVDLCGPLQNSRCAGIDVCEDEAC